MQRHSRAHSAPSNARLQGPGREEYPNFSASINLKALHNNLKTILMSTLHVDDLCEQYTIRSARQWEITNPSLGACSIPRSLEHPLLQAQKLGHLPITTSSIQKRVNPPPNTSPPYGHYPSPYCITTCQPCCSRRHVVLLCMCR